MSWPLMALGPHVFEVLPLNYQRLERMTEAMWASVPRLGARPSRQFVGLGDDPLTISGVIFPEEFGGRAEYEAIRLTQTAALPVPLIGYGAGTLGLVWGLVVITMIADSQEEIGRDGSGQVLAYDIEVAPYDEAGGGFGTGLW